MELEVNGERREIADGATVHDLLGLLELIGTPGVGVECNGEFVEPDTHATHTLNPGDSVQVVRFLGGG